MLAKNKKIIGNFGENIAKKYIIKKGYKIIAQNKNFSNYEIDIIAQIKNKIVFFEVKTSSNYSLSDPEDYIDNRKLKNLKKASYIYSREERKSLEKIFFDLLAIKIDSKKKIATVKHYKNIC